MVRREYHYVGPAKIGDIAKLQPYGTRITTVDELRSWIASSETDRSPDGTHIATFAINLDGELLLAPRRSEHDACASGGPVLSAGEVGFDTELAVTEISNQSTGFCPEPESWFFVETALDRIGLAHPGRFTNKIAYRFCPECHERNAVKDSWFYCALCNGKLPEHWNFTRDADEGEP